MTTSEQKRYYSPFTAYLQADVFFYDEVRADETPPGAR